MMIHSPKDLAVAVVSQRKKLKLNQSDVAKLVGLKQQTVSAFENKPENTRLATLFRILSAVKLNLDTLSKNESTHAKSLWKEEW